MLFDFLKVNKATNAGAFSKAWPKLTTTNMYIFKRTTLTSNLIPNSNTKALV